MVASDAWMLARRFLAFCSADSCGAFFDCSAVRASSSACCEISVRLKSSLARSKACVACTSSALALSDVRRLLDLRQVLRVGRAVLRQRPRERRLLLLERVLLFLAVELDEDLPGLHAIAEVRQDARAPCPSASDEIVT